MKYKKFLLRWGVLSAAVVGLSGSVFAFLFAGHLAAKDATNRFNYDAVQSIADAIELLEFYETGVRTLKSFYECSEEVTRDEFKQFTRPLLEGRSEIRALCWFPKVEQSHTGGLGGETPGETPATDRRHNPEMRGTADSFPLSFARPLDGNEPLLGMNASHCPAFYAAIQKAVSSGSVYAVIDRTFFSSPSDSAYLVLVAPVFSEDISTQNAQAAAGRLLGCVAGVYDM